MFYSFALSLTCKSFKLKTEVVISLSLGSVSVLGLHIKVLLNPSHKFYFYSIKRLKNVVDICAENVLAAKYEMRECCSLF